jgi:magnesium transporter
MDLETALARTLLETHPSEAAHVLEGLEPEVAAALLAAHESERTARVVGRMPAPSAAALLGALPDEDAVDLLGHLAVDVAARFLHPVPAARRGVWLERLPVRRARALRSLLRYPEGTAGALMDPASPALPHDVSAGEALERVRDAPPDAHCQLYVVDRSQRLVGVVGLGELLAARPDQPLAALTRPVHALQATADRHAIVSDPAWRELHTLPVVDADGIYLGALGYGTLRQLEAELRGPSGRSDVTARAIGDLLRASAAGLLEAVAAGTPAPPAAPEPGRIPHGA